MRGPLSTKSPSGPRARARGPAWTAPAAAPQGVTTSAGASLHEEPVWPPRVNPRMDSSATATAAGYAAAAGVVAVAVTHPLDTWAVHRQTNRTLPSLSPRVLYRGIVPATLQAGIIYGVMIGTYEHLRSEKGVSVAAAAALSAVPESMVKGPLESLKNLKQTTRMTPKLFSVKALQLLGIGFGACLAREVPGNVAYFWCYEEARRSNLNPALSGALAATGFTLCSYPLEVFRAQIVTQSPMQVTMQGIGPYLLQGIAVTACLFTSYEFFNERTALGREH